MNLHRTDKRPDWASVTQGKRNPWQRVAAATNGIVTPGNIVTLLGLGLVFVGLGAIGAGHYWWGIGLLIVGRAADLLDGWAAEYTGTKSPLGEMFDAVADKVGTVATVIAFFAYGIAPWWVLGILVAPHIVIAIMTMVLRQRGRRLHPSPIGKISMATAWVGLIGLVMCRAYEFSWPQPFVVVVGLLVAISVLLGSVAAIGYARSRD